MMLLKCAETRKPLFSVSKIGRTEGVAVRDSAIPKVNHRGGNSARCHLLKAPPPRKRKHYSNAVTDDPAFRQLAALSFDLNEAEKLKIAHPWRVGSGRPAQDH